MTPPWQKWFLTQFENHPIDTTDQTIPVLPTFFYGEIPAGAMNGGNKLFTLANQPDAGTLRLYVNGIRQSPTDFILNGTQITFAVAPRGTDWLAADYTFTAPSA